MILKNNLYYFHFPQTEGITEVRPRDNRLADSGNDPWCRLHLRPDGVPHQKIEDPHNMADNVPHQKIDDPHIGADNVPHQKIDDPFHRFSSSLQSWCH